MVTFVLTKGRKLGFISKKENMRIPIAGPIIQKIGFLPLDRENPLKAMRTIHKAAKLVSDQGFTMGIYPEGTRSLDGKLLEFKTGAFVMAKKAACPMVISKIEGTNEYHGRFPLRRTNTIFTVLEVVPAEAVKEKKPEELSEYARKIIEENLNK
ncbi:MAG: 1-acyl-sn-glycerol-3-phosphate acyltransferase, partial [Clostridia bacterium]|nr:1-acyl-sn-glycerol-3-phosphate acyltransferase [Clostridia bacterium]